MELRTEQPPIELEGTHRIILRSSGMPLLRTGGSPSTVLLRNGERECGAIVERTESGDDAIAMDKYLLIHLHARAGDMVTVTPGQFGQAEEIELIVPTEFERRALVNLVRDCLVGKPLCEGQLVPLFVTSLTGEQTAGKVAVTRPAGIVQATSGTRVQIRAGRVSESGTTYRDIGGLSREIQRIREMIEYPIRHPQVLQRLGIVPPRGIILYGPPGTGKTLIAKALAHEAGATVHVIRGPEIMSCWFGGSEQNLRQVFEQAKESRPAIVLIDELDSIAPHRDQVRQETERRVVAELLTLMDGLSELRDVVVIGTTNAIGSIDPALRRPGRFEHEIHVGIPDSAGRSEILRIHTRRMPLAESVNLQAMAERTIGFVGADLASLCREAAYCALRRALPGSPEGWEPLAALPPPAVSQADFETALAGIRPSAMREIMVEVPADVSWADIGGLEEVRQLIVENVVYGLSRREAFQAVGIRPAKGMLLYGPPGTGKTLLAKVVARESGANFIAVKGPEVYSKWFGESEERIRQLFAKAREVAPCIIFFDELDAIAPTRGRQANGLTDPVVNQLLSETDGLASNDRVFVIGASNRAELIDPALLRPGRFDYQIFVPLPDRQARRAIFAVHLRGKPVPADLDLGRLAELAGDFSGADIAETCRLAALECLRGAGFDSTKVLLGHADFEKAIEQVAQTKRRLTRPRIGFGASVESEQ